MRDIGKNIRDLRERSGLTQEALAENHLSLAVTRLAGKAAPIWLLPGIAWALLDTGDGLHHRRVGAGQKRYDCHWQSLELKDSLRSATPRRPDGRRSVPDAGGDREEAIMSTDSLPKEG